MKSYEPKNHRIGASVSQERRFSNGHISIIRLTIARSWAFSSDLPAN